MKKIFIKFLLLFFAALPVYSQVDNPLNGHWEGRIDFSSAKLDIKTDFQA